MTHTMTYATTADSTAKPKSPASLASLADAASVPQPLNAQAQRLVSLQHELRHCQWAREVAERNLAEMGLALSSARQALANSLAREGEARLKAGRDPLTGLPNRLSFSQRSSQTLDAHAVQARAFCVLFIDLDGFKAVNDCLGHAAGDSLLKVISARLMHALRGDDFVSRHGGDEFVCLLPEVQHEDHALSVARKLIETVSAPCRIGDTTVQLSASVGVALYPSDGHTVDHLLERADQAMLWAKRQHAGLGLASRLPAPKSLPKA